MSPGFPTTWEQIQHLLLPVVTLSLIPMGIIARLVRATVLEVLSRDFVASLDARGLRRPTVLAHVAKNAAPAVLALMGLQFGYLLGGSILIETVFNWPGVGNLLNLAIFRRDIPVIQATILMLALFFVLINLGGRHPAGDDRSTHAADLSAMAVRARPAPTAAGPPRGRAPPAQRVPGDASGGGSRVIRSPSRAAAILLAIFLMVILAPLLTTYDPYVGSALRRLRPIGTPGHWLGTDEIGRDIYTRLLYGGRLSLLAGVTPVGFALLIGGSLGLVAGYVGGWINIAHHAHAWTCSMHFPSVLLAVAICSIVGAGLTNTVIALTIVFIPPIVRLTESVTTQIRNLDYVLAARASGASTSRSWRGTCSAMSSVRYWSTQPAWSASPSSWPPA